MSFRQFGGLQFASKHNAVASNYNTSNNLLVTKNVGQSNSYINFLSDISGNQIFGNVDVNGNLRVSGDIDSSGNLTASKIYLTAPFHNYASTEVVPKSYVDTVGSGLIPYGRVKAISTYDSSANNTEYPVPIGTSVANPFLIDGVQIDVSNNVLLNDQGSNSGQDPSANNGVYTLNSSRIFQRSTTIFPSGSDSKAAYISVVEGTANSLSGWVQINDALPNKVGITPLIFSNFFSFAFKLGQGLYSTQQNEQVYINVDPSLNFIQYLDNSGNTLNIGNYTNIVNIGKVSAGNNKISVTQNGVGINNNNPSSDFVLDVSGNLHMNNMNAIYGSNSLGIEEVFLAPRWSDNASYLNYGTNGFYIRNNTSNATMFMNNSNQVGIGTTSPASTLDVSGNGNFTGLITAQSPSYPDNTTTVPTTSWVNTAISSSASKWTTQPSTTNIYYNSGNVGIGTTTPAYTLDVSGNTNVSGISYFNTKQFPSWPPTYPSPSEICNNAPIQIRSVYDTPDKLILTSDPSNNTAGIIQYVWDNGNTFPSNQGNQLQLNPYGGCVFINKLSTDYYTNSYALDVSGNIKFSGSVVASGLTVTNAPSAFIAYQESNKFYGMGTINGALCFSANQDLNSNNPQPQMVLNSSGRLGIGTTSPASTLDVNGNLNTTMDASINSITVGRGGGNNQYNTALGIQALFSNTSGAQNVALGIQALYSNTTGSQNTAVGSIALYGNSTGTNNVAIGYYALYGNSIGYDNVAIGYQAIGSNLNTGYQNIAIGSRSLTFNTTGYENTAIGYYSLSNNNTGYENTAIGYQALQNTNAEANTAIGATAGYSITTGNYNTAIGGAAGYNITTGSNNTCIGAESQPSSGTVSNEITLGDNNPLTVLRCVATSITAISDARDKKDIEPLTNGITFIDQLKPVKFIWNMRDGGKVDIPAMGFIAQDLKQVQKDTGITVPNLVYESNPDRLEASYGTLLPILVKAVQELSAEVKALKTELNELKNK